MSMARRQCHHAFEGTPIPKNNSWVLEHCLGDDDETCWCEPDVLVFCPYCDNDPSDEEDHSEDWNVCSHCGNFGLLDAYTVEDLEEDEPLLIVHKDR